MATLGATLTTTTFPTGGGGDVGVFNAETYGAVGDQTTNDTAAIQAAIDAAFAAGRGIVLFPRSAYYKVTSLNMKAGVTLQGIGMRTAGGGGSIILGTAGSSVLVMPTTGSPDVGTNYTNMALRDITINGGTNGIRSTQFISNLSLDNVKFTSQSNAGIYTQGRLEQWYFDNVWFEAAPYGWKHDITLDAQSVNYISKSEFRNLQFIGHTENPIKWEMTNGQSVKFSTLTFHTCQKSACDIRGDLVGLTIENPYTEMIGQSGKNAKTTGSISASSAALTVASRTGFTNGDPIHVQSAGSSGNYLSTTVASGGGTTGAGVLTLAAAASNTVASKMVTNASYDVFVFTQGGGADFPSFVTFIGGSIEIVPDEHVRWFVNNASHNMTIIGVKASNTPVFTYFNDVVEINSSVDVQIPGA